MSELRRVLIREINRSGDPVATLEGFIVEFLELHSVLRMHDKPEIPWEDRLAAAGGGDVPVCHRCGYPLVRSHSGFYCMHCDIEVF